MNIAVYSRKNDSISIKTYKDIIVKYLISQNINIHFISRDNKITPEYNLIWDPGLGMKRVPKIFQTAKIPIVVTIHGLRSFSLPISKTTNSYKGYLKELVLKKVVSYDWKHFSNRLNTAISVSKFGAQEIESALDIPRKKISPVYHGVDHNIFKPINYKYKKNNYLLTISQYQPKKNIDRLFTAYKKIDLKNKPPLIAILPGYNKTKEEEKNIKIINKPLDHISLIKYYQEAMGFLFPSLHETFGMPILEAMACGCPVITSNSTGCAEIAGHAATLVDPNSTKSIGSAIERLINDNKLQRHLREAGVKRASEFSWEKSAKEHLNLFENIISHNE